MALGGPSQKENRDIVFFQRKLESLPPDEQPSFRNRKHPSQNKSGIGMIVARCCAQALWEKIRHDTAVKRVAAAGDKDGWALEVVLNTDVGGSKLWETQPFYRGFMVYRRVEV